MFHLFAAFAEFERNLIEERSAAGRAASKARGRLGGRPEKYGSKDIEMMKALIESGTPIKDVAEKYDEVPLQNLQFPIVLHFPFSALHRNQVMHVDLQS